MHAVQHGSLNFNHCFVQAGFHFSFISHLLYLQEENDSPPLDWRRYRSLGSGVDWTPGTILGQSSSTRLAQIIFLVPTLSDWHLAFWSSSIISFSLPSLVQQWLSWGTNTCSCIRTASSISTTIVSAAGSEDTFTDSNRSHSTSAMVLQDEPGASLLPNSAGSKSSTSSSSVVVVMTASAHAAQCPVASKLAMITLYNDVNIAM